VLLVLLLIGVARSNATWPTGPGNISGAPSIRTVPASRLTRREVEVLRLMAAGLTYAQIASRLVIDDETVRSHAKGILRKLGQSSRGDAVAAARRSGIL
jgi:DNA-binding NarL/FixJ family response regulator